MLLTLLLASLFVLVVSWILFAGIAPAEPPRPEVRPEPTLVLQPSRFFARDGGRPGTADTVPLEVLLSRIEQHVRLEQAAVESFLERPTPESLHSPTASPLVN